MDKDTSQPGNGARPLDPETTERIQQFDTCTISNAIERFGTRLRNQGFTRTGLHCLTGGFPRVLGYAATFRIRSSDPPMTGGSYLDRTEWWETIGALPVPRIAVIEDLGADIGPGAVGGEVHAAILKAFQCGGLVTNGAIRDLPALAGMQFPVFARGLAVSHSYAHLVDYGNPVNVLGLEIRCGDLVYADCHGALTIPHEIAAELPEVAERIRANERRIIEVCQSAGFSPAKLLESIKSAQ